MKNNDKQENSKHDEGKGKTEASITKKYERKCEKTSRQLLPYVARTHTEMTANSTHWPNYMEE